jgi:ribonuclease BN (tRNA processing enzyme)
LPGLILSLQVNAKAMVTDPITLAKKEKQQQQQGKQEAFVTSNDPSSSKMRVLHIYGPEGLYELVATVLRLIHADLNFLQIEVHELVKGLSRSVVGGGGDGPFSSAGRSVFLARSLRRNLIRRAVPQNPDGTWTLEEPMEMTTPEEAKSAPSSGRGVYVTAAELRHVPKLTCLGYVFREPRTQPRQIDQKKAIAAGVRPGKKYNQLKYGFSVPSDVDPSVVVHPDQVLVGIPRPSRSVAILGDCCAVPEPMSALCKDVDVLVHESTLSETDANRAASRGVGKPGSSRLSDKIRLSGHSTAAMAGRVARRVQPKVLLLNHISTALRVRFVEQDLVKEAERQLASVRHGGYDNGNGAVGVAAMSTRPLSLSWPLKSTPSPTPSTTVSAATTRVQIGYDHLEIMVPAEGFPW